MPADEASGNAEPDADEEPEPKELLVTKSPRFS